MILTPYAHLTWAYQLHYYLCFRTYRRRPFFNDNKSSLAESLKTLFGVYGYHSLEMKLRASDVLLLLSLRPDHRISEVLKKLKGESSTALCRQLGVSPPLWARGYLARTAGRARLSRQRLFESTSRASRLPRSPFPTRVSVSLRYTGSSISCPRELRFEIPLGPGDGLETWDI